MKPPKFFTAGGTRSHNAHLFVAGCLLSVVSWYTTEQGMALYLSGWLSLLASLGVQSALVFAAWRIGFVKARRMALIAIYAITAAVSVSFSYVSLYTWFAGRQRPAQVQRKLYDTLNAATDSTQQLLESAIGEGQKHVLALQEMTVSERTQGYISRGQDADPYLAGIRGAVTQEAQTSVTAYRGGAGRGAGYAAFDRYTKLTRQSVEHMQEAQRSLVAFRAQLKPLEPSEKQLRDFRQVYDAVPWNDVAQSLHPPRFERPAVPNYADYVDQSASGQEDLLLAFQELFTAPSGHHAFALLLAAFIDAMVSLLAYASGPSVFGSAEQRWFAAGAALDALDDQIFMRDFLRKLGPDVRGMARVAVSALSAGEQQVCLLLAAKELATSVEENGKIFYLLSPEAHEQLLESSRLGS